MAKHTDRERVEATRAGDGDAFADEPGLSSLDPGGTTAALPEAPLAADASEAPASATAAPLPLSGVRTQSLADLARRSVENKQASEREIARESLALAARTRPKAEEVQALRAVMNSRMPAPASLPEAAAPAPDALPDTNSVALADQRGALAPSRAPQARGRRAIAWPRVALGSGAVVLAAVWLLWLRQPAPQPLITTLVSAAEEAAAHSASSAPALQGVPSGVDPSTLPEAKVEVGAAVPGKIDESSAVAPAAARSVAGARASALHVGKRVVLGGDPSGAAEASAAAPAEQPVATPPHDPALRVADNAGGALPAKPSTGAVQAALGTVMSGARRCVAGDSGASSAVVTFASDGHVQSVVVNGPAVGNSAAACIQAQLGRARLQPFAAPNFSVSATVRPD